jgi:hypothetical protein
VQVVEGGDGGGQVTLSMVQLFDVPRYLFDLREGGRERMKGKRKEIEGVREETNERERDEG